jgi:hypothetical protein
MTLQQDSSEAGAAGERQESPRYEFTAAVQHVSGYPEPVGVAFAEDEHPDARKRALDEYYAWVRDSNMIDPPARVVFMRRPISTWEVIDV